MVTTLIMRSLVIFIRLRVHEHGTHTHTRVHTHHLCGAFTLTSIHVSSRGGVINNPEGQHQNLVAHRWCLSTNTQHLSAPQPFTDPGAAASMGGLQTAERRLRSSAPLGFLGCLRRPSPRTPQFKAFPKERRPETRSGNLRRHFSFSKHPLTVSMLLNHH